MMLLDNVKDIFYLHAPFLYLSIHYSDFHYSHLMVKVWGPKRLRKKVYLLITAVGIKINHKCMTFLRKLSE